MGFHVFGEEFEGGETVGDDGFVKVEFEARHGAVGVEEGVCRVDVYAVGIV